MTNEHTSLEKYTSHTLFSKGLRKGWCWLCVRGELETEQTATYWSQVPLYYSSTSSSFCWAAQSKSWGPKPSVWRWLSLPLLVPNCNWNSNFDCNSNWTLPASNSNCTQTVSGTWLYNCLTCTCFLWTSHLHRIQPVLRSRWYSTGCSCFLIDGLVEGQYVTEMYLLVSVIV